jgi:hypothetical protein
MILLLAYAFHQSQGMEAAGFAKPKEAFVLGAACSKV